MGQEQLDLPSTVLEELGHHGLAFQAEVLEFVLRRDPEDLDAWCNLGHACTRLGRFERGLEVDREIVRRLPDDPTARYNLACSLALLRHPDEAFAELERALEHGYDDPD